MIFRGDQHVDDWAEVAVDYLDGQLDPETRLAVESHLAGCPQCSARLRTQHSVVRFLQETPLDDPPEDLEYRAIGELIFPSPGGKPVAPPVEVEKRTRTSRWYRTLRAWMPAAVAVCALLAAVVGYGIVRSNSSTVPPETNSDRAAGAISTLAAGTTAAASTSAESTVVGGGATMTTAAAATTTTAGAAQPPATEQTPSTFVATQDRRTMIRELETSRTPAYVSFRATVTAPTEQNPITTAAGAMTTAPGATTTLVSSETTSAGGTAVPGGTATQTTAAVFSQSTDTTDAAGAVLAPVTAEQAANVVAQLEDFTGMRPLDRSLWLGGPTYAAFLPRQDAEELVDLVRSIGASVGLVVRLEGSPPAASEGKSGRLLEEKKSFPVLEAQRALQPATWGYDFTTSSLPEDSGDQSRTTATMPDQAGTHVVLIIWIAQ